MTESLEQALVRDFPKFFRDFHGDPLSTCMAWGIEHGDGWEPSFRKLNELIKQYISLYPEGTIDFYWSQVKEKFGTPRWYYSGGDDIIDALVSHYERLASTLCEQCGEWGSLKGKYWVYTACDDHTKEKDR
jgi:hypothetical protein